MNERKPYRIVIGLPEDILQKNKHRGNSKYAAIKHSNAVKDYRREANFETKRAIAKRDKPGDQPKHRFGCVRATFHHAIRRKRDRMNLSYSLHPVWDGMEDAGLIKDDWGLTELPPVRKIDKVRPRVVIEFWPTRD